MLKPWARWGSTLVPTLTSGAVTTYLLVSVNWRQWGIEEMAPMTSSSTSFADLANITFAAECIAQGQPIQVCDPYGRPFQPYVVLPARVLAALGLGTASTGTIGILLGFTTVALVAGLAFLVASHWRAGTISLYCTQIALALGAISPGVILGMERGQIESLTALLVVISLVVFTKPTVIRWLGVPLSFAATALKYLTVGMFLAFVNRATFTRKNWAALVGVAASGAFLILSVSQVRQAAETSESGTAQTTMSAFGLTNTIATPLSGKTLSYYPPPEVADAWPTLRIIGLILFAVITVALYMLVRRRIELPSTNSLPWVLTIGSGGVLLLPYLIGSSHDYRLIFLLPLIAGSALWAGNGMTMRGRAYPWILILSANVALATSASMLSTPQGWRWPVWAVFAGDLGLLFVLASIPALIGAHLVQCRPTS